MKTRLQITSAIGLCGVASFLIMRDMRISRTEPGTYQRSATAKTKIQDVRQAEPRGSRFQSGKPIGPMQPERVWDYDSKVILRAGNPMSAPLSRDELPVGTNRIVDWCSSKINGRMGAGEIIAALRQIRSGVLPPFTADEREAAYRALTSGEAPEGVTPAQWHGIADEILSTLRAVAPDPSELVTALDGAYRNTGNDPVLRDYALQHLGHYHGEGGDPEAIEATLSAALSDRESTLAGAALLAMHRASRHEGLATPMETGASAYRIAGNPAVDTRSRLTALQVAAKQGFEDALPLALSTASDPESPIIMRMAALATIADLGDSSHRNTIRLISQASDLRLRSAARAALEKLTPIP